MTEKEAILAYLHHDPTVPVPEGSKLDLMGGSDVIRILDIPVCERPLKGTGYDVFGVHWSATEGVSHYTVGQKPIYDDIEDWREQVRFPKAENFDWSKLAADAKAVDRSACAVSVVMYCGPFERTTMLTSFENCLMDLISEPEEFGALIDAIADYKISLIEKIWEVAQPDIYLIHDDWGTMKSTFMNPELWRQVIKPATKRIYDAIHAHGAVVAQHSCGAIGTLVGDMVELGADAWDGQPECNDFPSLEAQYGAKMVFLKKPPRRALAPDAPKPPMPNEAAGGYDAVPEFLYR